MIQEQVTIINKLGLHARAAAKFVSTSGRFASKIRVAKEGQEVDGKSIMAVMMLAASKGTLLTLKIEGPDEEEAFHAIKALIEDYFGEGE
ncbi:MULTISPECIES: HPr family phosphocarrier protein [Hahella]|uniref:Phosphocarrier protein HPr n=1 Tax=Hahella chejuensis (strain KCTC 2396) TaxID=349521 RepID=Q2SBH7_HAHCH|nr:MULTISPECIES: HPr family phosphocarrier protein [Hahella]ABC31997.1 phosphocarrier protein HPr [Hahella chejuensis KCTC 2396]AZZ90851.1 HPr family phosphocarrier protein [Hahella sp. KA22]MBU6949999.1 HPr family phosphocarrier protein [Hahella sp. HN01]MDG9668208.1 HPr family phosphocarrier protein [Hahella sp. CR1]QAY54221.1 HPr family phosphocarrier protein [Hahella sp. KA22]